MGGKSYKLVYEEGYQSRHQRSPEIQSSGRRWADDNGHSALDAVITPLEGLRLYDNTGNTQVH